MNNLLALFIVLCVGVNAYAQSCDCSGATIFSTDGSTVQLQPPSNNPNNQKFCFSGGGTITVTTLQNLTNPQVCVEDGTTVNFELSGTTELKGQWDVYGSLNLNDSGTSANYLLGSTTNFNIYPSGVVNSRSTGNVFEISGFQGSGDMLNIAAGGELNVFLYENHGGPVVVGGSIEAEYFQSHNKGSVAIELAGGCIKINNDLGVRPDGVTENQGTTEYAINSQNIRGEGSFVVLGALVANLTTNFVGSGDGIDVYYESLVDLTHSNTPLFGANTTQNVLAPGEGYSCNTSSISGTIYDDTGVADDFDGAVTGTSGSATPLYATLLDDSDNVVASVLVDNITGSYSFSDVPDGDYSVMIGESDESSNIGSVPTSSTSLTGYVNTADGNSSTDAVDGTPNGLQSITVAGNDVTNVDFAIVESALIAGTITQDGTDANAIDGVVTSESTVQLYVTVIDAITNEIIASVAVDSNGEYEVPVAPSSNPYAVILNETDNTNNIGQIAVLPTVDELSGFEYVADGDTDISTAGDGSVDGYINVGVVTSGMVQANNDFEIAALSTVNLSGTVYENTVLDGTVSGTTPTTLGVTPLFVTLLDANGNVVRSAQVSGDGSYDFIDIPASSTYTLFLGESDETPNIGNMPVSTTSLSGYVNTAEGDIDGAQPSALGATTTSGDGTVTGITVAIVEDQDNVNVDFAIEQSLPASISGFVKYDADGTGSFTTGDAPISGVQIELYSNAADTDNDGVLSAVEVANASPVATTITQDATVVSGLYEFDDVTPGDYFIVEAQPADYNSVIQLDNSADADAGSVSENVIPVSVVGGEVDSDNDFLEEPSNVVSISGDVDRKQNDQAQVGQNVQDDVAGATIYVSLVNDQGVVIAVTTVMQGNSPDYLFENVPANATYSVVIGGVLQTVGSVFTSDATDINGYANYGEGDTFDESLNNGNGQSVNTNGDGTPNGIQTVVVTDVDNDGIDFDLSYEGKLSGYVIYDVASSANPTGDTQYQSESNGGLPSGGADDIPISGVSIELYSDANGNGIVDGLDALIATEVTDVNGFYEFDGLSNGNYTIQQVQPFGYVSKGEEDIDRRQVNGYNDNDGNEDNNSSDNTIAAQLQFPQNNPGENDVLNNFYETGVVYELSGTAFQDESAINDDTYNGGEVVVPSILVELFEDANGNGVIDPSESTPIATTETGLVLDPNDPSNTGYYEFVGLSTGDYIVMIDGTDNDTPNDYAAEFTTLIANIVNTKIVNIDFPYEPAYDVFGTLFQDDIIDNSGMDTNEPVITGVQVSIYPDNGSGEPDLSATPKVITTDAAGSYEFNDMPNGDYVIVVDPLDVNTPGGYSPEFSSIAVTVNNGDIFDNDYPYNVYILDVQLIDFELKVEDDKVLLTWEVIEDGQTTYFVEFSNNGVDFQTIALVEGISETYYGIVDYDFVNSGYYRLKILNEGEFTFSNIIVAESPVSEAVSVFPNPLLGANLNVDLTSILEESIVKIYSINGQLLYAQTFDAAGIYTISMSSYSESFYFVEVVNESYSEVFKVSK